MNDLNKVILIGRVTRDPELKTTSNSMVCKFTLASNHSIYNKATNENKQEVGYFDCIAWGKTGEILAKYLTKGKRVAIEGSLRYSSWEGSDGKKRSKIEVYIEQFQFIDNKVDQMSDKIIDSPNQ